MQRTYGCLARREAVAIRSRSQLEGKWTSESPYKVMARIRLLGILLSLSRSLAREAVLLRVLRCPRAALENRAKVRLLGPHWRGAEL